MRFLRFILLTLLIVVLGMFSYFRETKALGISYYLDCDALTDGNGTSATPFKTLSKASSFSYQPGDSLLLKRGCTWNNQTLTISASGNSAQNILVDAYGSGANPVIKITNNGADISLKGSYVTIQNLFLASIIVNPTPVSCTYNGQTSTLMLGHPDGVDIESGANYNTIRNIEGTGFYAAVWIKSGAHDNHILNNNFHDNLTLDTGYSAGAFGVLIHGHHNEVAYNRFNNNNACSPAYGRDGSSVEIYGDDSTNGASFNNIHHNFSLNDDAFTELGKSSSAIATDNTFAYNQYVYNSPDNHGIFVVTRGSGDSRGPIYRTNLYNNTAYLTGNFKAGIVCFSTCSTSLLKMRNNIIQKASAISADGPFDEDYDIFVGNGPGSGMGVHSLQSSNTGFAQFSDVALGNFRLKSTSPAINAGVNLGYTSDLDGNVVPYPFGGAPDMGAYEFGSIVNLSPTATALPSATPTPIIGNGNVCGTAGVTVDDLKCILSGWLNTATTLLDQYKDGKINSMDFGVVVSKISLIIPTATPTGIQPTITPTKTPTPTPTRVPTPIPTLVPGSGAVVVAVGDIRGGSNALANLTQVEAINPVAILGLGDFQYDEGSCFNFLSNYDNDWGKQNFRMWTTFGPTHDYNTDPASSSRANTYFSGDCILNGVSQKNPESPAATLLGGTIGPMQPYSFDLNGWHIIQLPSLCYRYGCDSNAITTWLTNDLNTHTNQCSIAFFHEAYWTSPSSGHTRVTSTKPWVQLLYDHGVELLFQGHQHNYERFYPQNMSDVRDDARGITSFTVGTGGIGFYTFNGKAPNSAARNDATYGVLKLTLGNGVYNFQFVPAYTTATFSDSGSGTCH